MLWVSDFSLQKQILNFRLISNRQRKCSPLVVEANYSSRAPKFGAPVDCNKLYWKALLVSSGIFTDSFPFRIVELMNQHKNDILRR